MLARTVDIEELHPGRTVAEDYLTPTGTTVNAMAKAIGVPASRLNDTVLGRRGITADTALRLTRYLGTTPDFWMGIQMEYEIRKARRENGSVIEKQVTPQHAA